MAHFAQLLDVNLESVLLGFRNSRKKNQQQQQQQLKLL